jgi:hypothetical protein
MLYAELRTKLDCPGLGGYEGIWAALENETVIPLSPDLPAQAPLPFNQGDVEWKVALLSPSMEIIGGRQA